MIGFHSDSEVLLLYISMGPQLNLEQARVLLCGPMMAHCISKSHVLQFDSDWDAYMPIVDNQTTVIYEWMNCYLSKMRDDLISIGEWDRGFAM